MNEVLYDFYLAGPFFNAEQKYVMDEVYHTFKAHGALIADPRKLGPVIADLPKERRSPQLFKEIFEANIQGMNKSKTLLACIDDRDTGTAFEIGYFYQLRGSGKIITFSACGYGANVMLSHATQAHFHTLPELFLWVGAISRLAMLGRTFEELSLNRKAETVE